LHWPVSRRLAWSRRKFNSNPVRPRFIGLFFTLLGAIRQVRELAKAQQYAEARNFNVQIYSRTDTSGDRVVVRVEWVPRPR